MNGLENVHIFLDALGADISTAARHC